MISPGETPRSAGAALALTRVEAPGRGGDGPLRGVSLVAPAGVICVLTGHHGCGASTLVRGVADRHGDALFADPDALVQRASVYDNIALGLPRRGATKAESEARTLQAAEAMGLAPLMARAVRALSAEQRWRVVLARILALQPALVLADEPFAGVAGAGRAELRRAFRRIQCETGATVLCAARDVADALALADLLVVMEDGVILQSGAPAELYASPGTVAVGRLSGPFGMNLLPVRANQTGLSLESGVTLGAASVMTGATHAVLGVRPEHLFALEGDSSPAHGLSLPLTVEAVEAAGADLFVIGDVGGCEVTARLANQISVAAGGVMRLGARREHLHLFDAVTLAAQAVPAVAMPETAPAIPRTAAAPATPAHLQRDPRGDDEERSQHERRLAAARARLTS